MLNEYHKECAEESDEDYSDECESSEHTNVSSASEEEPDEDGPDGNNSADDAKNGPPPKHTRYNVHYKLCKNYPNLVHTGVKKCPAAKGLRVTFILILILIYCSFLREFPRRNNSLF